MQENENNPASLFTTAGLVKKNSQIYVKRRADDHLYANLLKGNFCYFDAPRLIGKSSLRIRTSQRLIERGIHCIQIDLSSFGQVDYNADQFFYTISYIIARKTNLEFDLTQYTKKNIHLSPVNRFVNLFKDYIFKELSGNIVLFFDELEYVPSRLQTEFNNAITTLYLERNRLAVYNRLSVVLLGIPLPQDRFEYFKGSPFCIGTYIPFGYFKLANALETLKLGFKNINTDHDQLISEIFHWTNGHPAMSQKLCFSIAEGETEISDIPLVVEQHVDYIFFTRSTHRADDASIRSIHTGLTNTKYSVELLQLLYKIQNGEKIQYDKNDLVHLYIIHSGLIIEDSGILVIGNRIMDIAFNKAWTMKQLEDRGHPVGPSVHELKNVCPTDRRNDSFFDFSFLKVIFPFTSNHN